MSHELRKDTVGELFMNLMQHMKCIEVRLDYAKATTSQKQKYAINNALLKVRSAINHICDLLGDSSMVLKVKQNLDKTDLVYVMVLTEQLFNLPQEDLEHITEMIDQHLNLKYGADVEPE
jgi:hypothetical protein